MEAIDRNSMMTYEEQKILDEDDEEDRTRKSNI